MNIDTILIYTIVSFFYITSPGPAIVLAILNGLNTNLKILAISSFANISGLFILSSISILGLGTLLTTNIIIFNIVKFIGAFYLIYLGIKMIKNGKELNLNNNLSSKNKTNLNYFLESFFLAVTNPKPILFFTAIFPQFLNLNNEILPQFIVMTSIFLIISFSSLFTYGFIAKKSKKLFTNKSHMHWFHKITGGIFIGMGIALSQFKNIQ